jgi:hypothetical protein
MTDLELAWVVGLLEGEGCFGWHRTQKKYKYPRVQFATTDEDVIRKFHAIVEVGSTTGPRAYTGAKAHWKPRWDWYVTGKKAEELMTLLLPYMGERRQAAIREVIG